MWTNNTHKLKYQKPGYIMILKISDIQIKIRLSLGVIQIPHSQHEFLTLNKYYYELVKPNMKSKTRIYNYKYFF